MINNKFIDVDNENSKNSDLDNGVLINGNVRYVPDEENLVINRQKFVKKTQEWVHVEMILTMLPKRIYSYENPENGKHVIRMEYMDRILGEGEQDFENFKELKKFIKKHGKIVGVRGHWWKYLELLYENSN